MVHNLNDEDVFFQSRNNYVVVCSVYFLASLVVQVLQILNQF